MSETSADGCPAFVRLMPSHDPTACLRHFRKYHFEALCMVPGKDQQIFKFLHFQIQFYSACGPRIRYSDRLRAGRSGDRIPVGARFPALVQTGPGAHPASYIFGTGSFLGVRGGRCVTLTPHPTSSVFGHERVELYLYSPYGPWGLQRASVPVQG
jgi:hypothetical protein